MCIQRPNVSSDVYVSGDMMRICQANGNWSGSALLMARNEYCNENLALKMNASNTVEVNQIEYELVGTSKICLADDATSQSISNSLTAFFDNYNIGKAVEGAKVCLSRASCTHFATMSSTYTIYTTKSTEDDCAGNLVSQTSALAYHLLGISNCTSGLHGNICRARCASHAYTRSSGNATRKCVHGTWEGHNLQCKMKTMCPDLTPQFATNNITSIPNTTFLRVFEKSDCQSKRSC